MSKSIAAVLCKPFSTSAALVHVVFDFLFDRGLYHNRIFVFFELLREQGLRLHLDYARLADAINAKFNDSFKTTWSNFRYFLFLD